MHWFNSTAVYIFLERDVSVSVFSVRLSPVLRGPFRVGPEERPEPLPL